MAWSLRAVVLALCLALVSISLQGCWTTTPSTTPAPTPAPAPLPPPSPALAHLWKSAPLEIRGQHVYNSKTKEQVFLKGIGMPNVGDDMEEWMKVLERVIALAQDINLLRLYTLPACALSGLCFRPFMRRADEAGIYVLVPGTGTTSGWWPEDPKTCGHSADGCYQAGQVLAWGQRVVQHFNYPNVLAIVIGNEWDSKMLQYFPAMKAYARDLKSHMDMCNNDKESPTLHLMRKIPVAVALSDADAQGDEGLETKTDYLFCDRPDVSADIVGVNMARWCEDDAGKEQYTKLNSWIAGRNYPGAFIFSEMGCSKAELPAAYAGVRTWNQVPGFFDTFSALGGFVAYTYYGKQDFDMLDGPTSQATLFKDGQNFFDKLKHAGGKPKPAPTKYAASLACPEIILDVKLTDYNLVHRYDTGMRAPSCPRPYQLPYAVAAEEDAAAAAALHDDPTAEVVAEGPGAPSEVGTAGTADIVV